MRSKYRFGESLAKGSLSIDIGFMIKKNLNDIFMSLKRGCTEYIAVPWVSEIDIGSMFENSQHGLLMPSECRCAECFVRCQSFMDPISTTLGAPYIKWSYFYLKSNEVPSEMHILKAIG
ncbi:hypothetical protein N7490_007840 [Penicillium lividum]|nr:hypothetical protein N7490_007840 [Penicillium lividum]